MESDGFPCGSPGKESACNMGDLGLIPGSGRATVEGIGYPIPVFWGFPGGLDSKESPYNAGDLGLIPELGRSPGERNGYPPQHSSLENSMDRGAWLATVHGVTKSQT